MSAGEHPQGTPEVPGNSGRQEHAASSDPSEAQGDRSSSEGRSGATIKLLALIGLVVAGFLLARFTVVGEVLSREGIGEAVVWLQGSPWAPIIFIVAYATATALAVPGTVLTLAGGAVFGVFWGTVYNSIAANIGANAAFLLSRALGRDGIRRLMGDDSAALAKMDRVIGEHGFQGLLTLRLIPLVPFNALNFGSGLLPIRWGTYALATLVGIFPGTVVYTFFADALLQGSQEASQDALLRVLFAGGLLVLLSFTPALLKKMNIKLPGMAALVLVAAAVGPLAGSGQETQVAGEAATEQASDLPAADALVDHGEFSAVLAPIVVGGLVDYGKLLENRTGLDAYLSTLAQVSVADVEAAPRTEQLAFWINAYNACMLKRVVDHYPITRAGGLAWIKNRIAGRPANSVWQIRDVFTEAHCQVAGASRSQDEIEHSIIRPMGEPRIHFAVNCAALSCPVLVASAYEGHSLDEQLDARVAEFIATPAHFSVDLDTSTVTLNEILSWFGDDFGGPDGVREFFSRYVTGAQRDLLLDESTSLGFTDYDWTLNDVNR